MSLDLLPDLDELRLTIMRDKQGYDRKEFVPMWSNGRVLAWRLEDPGSIPARVAVLVIFIPALIFFCFSFQYLCEHYVPCM